MSVWPYTTRRWERVRKQKMMRDPLCEACLTVGEIVPAEVVDHRKPITKEGREKRSAAEAFPPLDDLASLCAAHHKAKIRLRVGRTACSLARSHTPLLDGRRTVPIGIAVCRLTSMPP